MSPFFAALGFLTILPLPPGLLGGERELGRSLPHFPLVGLLIGALAMALDAVLVFSARARASGCSRSCATAGAGRWA
jgi:cobalamin synthase